MKVKVKASVIVEVDLPDDIDPFFCLEENGCPGTDVVGAEIISAINYGDSESVCWACNLQGENKILSIDGVDVCPLP